MAVEQIGPRLVAQLVPCYQVRKSKRGFYPLKRDDRQALREGPGQGDTQVDAVAL
jgi:hypothetical protein